MVVGAGILSAFAVLLGCELVSHFLGRDPFHWLMGIDEAIAIAVGAIFIGTAYARINRIIHHLHRQPKPETVGTSQASPL